LRNGAQQPDKSCDEQAFTLAGPRDEMVGFLGVEPVAPRA